MPHFYGSRKVVIQFPGLIGGQEPYSLQYSGRKSKKYYGAPEESRWENYFAFPQNKFPLIHREKAELYNNKVLCSVQLSFSVVFA